MMLFFLAAVVYTVTIFVRGDPVAGWTTLMLVLSVGLAGLFGILSIVIKYLSVIIGLVFRRANYVTRSVEKL